MCGQCIWAKNTGRTLMCSCPESDERWNIVAAEMQCIVALKYRLTRNI